MTCFVSHATVNCYAPHKLDVPFLNSSQALCFLQKTKPKLIIISFEKYKICPNLNCI